MGLWNPGMIKEKGFIFGECFSKGEKHRLRLRNWQVGWAMERNGSSRSLLAH